MCPCQNENPWPRPRRDFEGEIRTLELQQQTDRQTIASLSATLATLQAENERLKAEVREVLKPFADSADWEEKCIDPDYGIARVRPLKDTRRVAVQLGECRAARALLSTLSAPNPLAEQGGE